MARKTFKASTIEKHVGFLHFLKFQLSKPEQDIAISNVCKEWGVQAGFLTRAVELGYLERTGWGKYRWADKAQPSEKLAVEILTALYVAPPKPKQALLPGPTDATPAGAKLASLERRVDELETIVIRLMESAA
jgi:hypothetical protein